MNLIDLKSTLSIKLIPKLIMDLASDRALIIGIAGGTASGKTSLANKIF